ncbi:MAG: MATE family efflux transporter [Alphaproteobacteria bacterium]|nr:MATE family efflux transporter [Alphaproteobacteria bacterium]
MAGEGVRAELEATLRLALPLAAAQLSQVLMGVTGAAMMGRLGGAALAAGGLGAALFFTVTIVFQGVLNAVGPLAAHALGAGAAGRVGTIVAHGLFILAALAAIGVIVVLNIDRGLAAIGHAPPLVALTRQFLHAAVWGLPAGLGFALFRSYLAAASRTWPVMVVLLFCLALNAALNDALIFGRFGAPPLGVAGAGYAAAAVQWIEFLGVAGYAALQPAFRAHGLGTALLRPNWREAAPILQLGWPIAGIFATEVGVFTATALLAGLLGTAALAAHQVAIGICSLTFMVPLAFSQAATVRVALADGAGRLAAARRAGFIALTCGVGFMAAMSVVIIVMPGAIVAIYLDRADPANAGAVATAGRLLVIAALFQVFDGTQTIAAGALRGLKDTRVPLLVGAIGYWPIGFFGGWIMAFPLGFGPAGLWWGLALGLAAVALPLTLRFRRLTRRPPLQGAGEAPY